MLKIIICCIILLFNQSFQALGEDLPTHKQWYITAAKYIEADNKILGDETNKKGNFAINYNLRLQAETQLLQSSDPSNDELIFLLNSKEVSKLKIALVNIFLKKIISEDIASLVVRNYWTNEDFFCKYYSQLYLKSVPNDIARAHKNEITYIFLNENNESVILAGMPTLLKFEPCDVAHIFAKYFTKSSNGLKRGSFAFLNTLDKEYFQKIKYCLTVKKNLKALSEIKTLENSTE